MDKYTVEGNSGFVAGAALTAAEKRVVRSILAGRSMHATVRATEMAPETVRGHLRSALAKAAAQDAPRGRHLI